MAGKNHIERSFRIFVDDSGATARDLTVALIPGTVQAGGIVLDEVDMTGVSQAVRNYLAGHGEAEIRARFHMDDTATTGAYTVLVGNDGGTGTVTLQYGQAGAAPTAGDPEFEGEYTYLGFSVVSDGGRMVLEARFLPTGATPPAWGTYS